MKTKNKIGKVLIFIGTIFLFNTEIKSQANFDSLKIKLPKHYFNTVINLDSYRKAKQDFTDTTDFLAKRLKSYGIKQFSASFYTPLFTDITEGKGKGITKSTHVLLTGNFLLLQPKFSGISQHTLLKTGIGIRCIFNSGKKGVWFVDASPFITKDITYVSKGYFRAASTIVYSHNPNEKFNWRIGITKSFMWGNKNYWPFLGIRIGKLDKVNLSIQFPRSINFNIPVGPKLTMSLYTKPQGGMYNFSNRDSLYYISNDATFSYTRYELNTGFRADVRVSNRFNFYVATGFCSKNNVTFYSETANKSRPRLPYKKYFFSENLGPTLFFNAGLVFKFGKSRSFYNEKNMYDVMDLNNTIGVGDNNQSAGNPQIPITPKVKKNLNLSSIQDLIDYNEF
ncbi:MAG: DUF6268 family outer membrane beta-barrel protein [Bacteroidota bacterium]|nr:DUF6268 family outer membrane beta-barrel protein [Bacteroidota bacterium]MDP3145057.1 DUF6268 family outer membrane beta-barrel protein [Bacteroidota bacterium]